jgi:hypothetical protein
MDFLESSLCRLQKYVPSAALWDVPSLKAQIELRQRALTDIEIIRRQLRPSCGPAALEVQSLPSLESSLRTAR